MALQLQKNQTILLLLILLALIIITVSAVMIAGNSSGDIVLKAIEGAGTYGTFDHNISPWAIDAERVMSWDYRF